MHVDAFKREVIFKIVYFGPGLSGKTTNLEVIYKNLDPQIRSDLISLKTSEERTLYFDFLEMELGRIKGRKPRFHLYTIPGQPQYGWSRQIVLRGADAVVFVADSQPMRMDDNLTSLMDLEIKLIRLRKTLARFPWVMQYNKRDLPQAESIEVLERKLNFLHTPFYEAVATKGIGVFETLKCAIQMAVQKATL
ncbi:MAG TPA: ADP-ribosylation factor-like protein [bacterium]|nr:ADP-ribosylation factor-like protein [bacterium]HPG45864.1 ADP-ribosylation factor-like protein [bacterium]HPM97909.1 ADP-ribosylation factor-like protein [bacterium]